MNVAVMPKFGLTMREGTVLRWLKAVGDEVAQGEPLLEIETDKVDVVIEAPASGAVRQILVEEDQTVPIMVPLALIGEPDEPLPSPEEISRMAATPIRPAFERQAPPMYAPSRPGQPAAGATGAGVELKASPVARRMAAEHGIELSTITGSGPGGRIVQADVEKAIQVGAAAPTEEGLQILRAIPVKGMRKTIGERMSRSAQTAPHVTVTSELDMADAVELQKDLTAKGLKLTVSELLVKAVAQCLARHPIFNSSLVGNEIKLWRPINIGVAVAVEEGLIVPVIRDADRKSLQEINQEMQSLTEKARNRTLSLQEVEGGTFTVTNLGAMGVDVFTPIINPPQVAILGVGRLRKRPQVSDEQIEIRPSMNFSLSFDHRVTDGAVAAQFLTTLQEILRNPHELSS